MAPKAARGWINRLAGIEYGKPSMRNRIRHGAAFLASGGTAFLTDAGILAALTRGAGMDPFTARLIAIACAMVVAFYAHRTMTFAVKTSPTWHEFAKFIGVATTASVINYAIYAGILLIRPGTDPLVALVAATAISMCFSYAGMRFGVFRKP